MGVSIWGEASPFLHPRLPLCNRGLTWDPGGLQGRVKVEGNLDALCLFINVLVLKKLL